jgi:hypothetical protein
MGIVCAVVSALVSAACGDSTATTFTYQWDGSSTDHLADGATINITLNADGTTTGRLFVPEGSPGGVDWDEDLAGTWAFWGRWVTFDHPARTFLRDMSFMVEANRLSGEETLGTLTVRVVLSK